jgi:GT2 family glycosyltransferase
MPLTVASVTVNANGGASLTSQLESLAAQSHPLDEIVVVDNGSTDGSREEVERRFPSVTMLPLGSNQGVGAAFSAGLRYAIEKGYDWVWLFDHDSRPRLNALEELLKAHRSLSPTHTLGILGCLPVDPESGSAYHGMAWTGRLRPLAGGASPKDVYFADSVISSGSLVRAEAVRSAGFPRSDFFIDYVDHEFNLRLRRAGYEIAVVPESVLIHRIGKPQVVRFGASSWVRAQEPVWRVYYATRNQAVTVRLYGRLLARVYLAIDMCWRAGGIVLWDSEKAARLKMLLIGLVHGLFYKPGRIAPPPEVHRGSQWL